MGKVAIEGKALYFLSILSAVTSRLMMFGLFSMALIKDKKPFYVIYVMFAIHIIIMMGLSMFCQNKDGPNDSDIGHLSPSLQPKKRWYASGPRMIDGQVNYPVLKGI